MNNTCAEQLPVELWLMIFRYLEGHDLFRAFENLNRYFKNILSSNYLLLFVRLKESDNNHSKFPNHPYWSDFVLNRIICLRPMIQSRSNYFLEFLRWHGEKLIQLKSLSLKISSLNTSEMPYVCQTLKNLEQLEYLSITCIPNEILIESILSLSRLRICQFVFKEVLVLTNYSLNVNSRIQQLFLVFLNNINYSLINSILICTQQLKRFEVSGSSYSFQRISIFAQPFIILPELRILKLKIECGYFESSCFTSLRMIMPALKYFYFHYNKHILADTFLDYLVSDWWTILDSIEYIDISIKGHIIVDDFDVNSLQMNLDKNRRILLNKINRTKKKIVCDWSEQDLNKLRAIEILIRKF